MEGLYLADEKCSLMELWLETFSEAIQESGSWLCELSMMSCKLMGFPIDE